ncbi:MAG: GyrI-like domain-containing protein [Pedobacter sp.]|nr:GyrI-like domain-containing protein [Pedobacter sp.]
MIDSPVKVSTEKQATAAIRLSMPRADIQKFMEPAIQELFAALAAQGIAPAGPLSSYHFKIDPAFFDFEICVPVAKPVNPVGRVINSALPALTVMRTNYHGPYENLGEAWGQFHAAIGVDKGCESGGLWECYVKGPESSPDPAQWITQLNQPLKV